MSARRRSSFPITDAPSTRSRSAAILQSGDWRELATGILVVGMALFGNKLSPDLFAHAADILITQVAFEFPMALLAVCAGQAIALKTRARRAAYVGLGMAAVLAAGTQLALQLDAPAMIIGGAWLILARVSPQHGSPWFSAEHCRTIEVTAGTAWACLIVALLLLSLLAAMTTPGGQVQTPPNFVYAITWSCYYLGLALLLPHVRAYYGSHKRRQGRR